MLNLDSEKKLVRYVEKMLHINSSRRRFVFCGMILVSLACYVAYLDRSGQFLFLTSSKQAARHKLSEVYTKVPIGISLDELNVRLAVYEFELYKMSIQHDSYDNKLRLRAPPEFPGFTTSWLVYFYTDGKKVIGKQIRSAEGNFVSCTAPADEGVVEMQARLDIACSNY